MIRTFQPNNLWNCTLEFWQKLKSHCLSKNCGLRRMATVWFSTVGWNKKNRPFLWKICVFKLAFHVRRFELRKSTVQQEQHQANQAQQAYALQQQQLNINMTAEAMQRQAADVNNNMTANVSDTTTVSTTSGLLQLETKNELMFNFFRLFRKVISKN